MAALLTDDFQVFIKPVGARCNLQCSYCYYIDKGEIYGSDVKIVMNDKTHYNLPQALIGESSKKSYSLFFADNFIWAFDINEDESIMNERKFAELYLTLEVLNYRGKSSGADGMKVDASGNLYVCTYIGVQIFNPEGNFIGILSTPTYPVNCAFGGPDKSTFYITSYNKVYSIKNQYERA